jgi:hypothetical protein
MIHTPSTKGAIPRSDLGILIGPSDCTYNAMQCYNIGSDAIMIRHHYTIFKHIPTTFPYPQRNLPTTPSAMVKRILKEKNPKDITDKDSQENYVKQPDDLSLLEAQVLMESLADDTLSMVTPADIENMRNMKRNNTARTPTPNNNQTVLSDVQIIQPTTVPHVDVEITPRYQTTLLDTMNKLMQNKDATETGTTGESEVTDKHNTESVTNTEIVNNQASEEFISNLEPTPIMETEENTDKILNKHIEVLPSVIKQPKKRKQVVVTDLPETKSQTVHGRSQRLRGNWKDGSARMKAMFAATYRLSVRQALEGEYKEETKEAIKDEIQNMLNYKVGHYVHWSNIPAAERSNILLAFMFIKHKTKPDGTYDKTKARIVGDGSQQKEHTYEMLCKIQYLRELKKLGIITPTYVPTLDITSDMMTKPLQGSLFQTHKSTLLGEKWDNVLHKSN